MGGVKDGHLGVPWMNGVARRRACVQLFLPEVLEDTIRTRTQIKLRLLVVRLQVLQGLVNGNREETVGPFHKFRYNFGLELRLQKAVTAGEGNDCLRGVQFVIWGFLYLCLQTSKGLLADVDAGALMKATKEVTTNL